MELLRRGLNLTFIITIVKKFERSRNVLKLGLLIAGVTFFIGTALAHPKVKVLHSDVLHFSSIFQEEYSSVSSLAGVPGAFLRGISKCNDYDLGRGRITNYIAFGVEAATRHYFPYPFISWLTMALVLLNSALLALLLTRTIGNVDQRVSLFSLVVLLLTLDPLFQYSYQMQFIYPKYLCVTFLLLFFVAAKAPFRLFFLLCAMFSDEIGLVADMLIIFIMVFERSIAAANPGAEGMAVRRGEAGKFLRPFMRAGAAALATLGVYWLILLTVFGTYGILGAGGGHFARTTNASVLHAGSAFLLKAANSVLGGNMTVTLFVLTLCCYLLLRDVKIWKGLLVAGEKGREFHVSWHFLRFLFVGLFVLFIVFVLYQGSTGFAYYAYPVATLVAFLVITCLVTNLPYRYAVGLLTVLLLVSAVRVPRTSAAMPDSPDLLEGMRSPVITQAYFDKIETAVNELKQGGKLPDLNAIYNSKELDFSGGYIYNEHYFPVSGMVRVLIWPGRLPGERTKYLRTNINSIRDWGAFEQKIRVKLGLLPRQ